MTTDPRVRSGSVAAAALAVVMGCTHTRPIAAIDNHRETQRATITVSPLSYEQGQTRTCELHGIAWREGAEAIHAAVVRSKGHPVELAVVTLAKGHEIARVVRKSTASIMAIDMRSEIGEFGVGNDRHIDVFCVYVARDPTGFTLTPIHSFSIAVD